ncbi:hypothetical protein SOCE26_085190 [Sorangium cellulosum]|uniref:Uncharacterized protein n=1 Tax=Sorangium cellulosum TaxID=56 RepID=A0A2L0F5Z0_SORCE|nr:DUF4419 domain-containing protein [Sorangium cellulosum]AUX47008.1 hypothetical protein SOCE26_085190 [Sorangium cellulosum]
MSITTIAVADVEHSTAPLPVFDEEAAVQSLLVSPVEAAFRHRLPLVGRTDVHPLVQAAYMAFTQRYSLVLSPDVIWFCLARGFTLHIAANEEQRRQFLLDERAFELRLDRPDFTLGQLNPWPVTFPEFSTQVAARIGKLWELVTANFSTTGPVERVASELTVMTPFVPDYEWEPPFPADLEFPSRGIPRVYLVGTADDWRWVRRRAAAFGQFGAERWTRALLPVLDQIVASAEGRQDPAFWRAFFRYENAADELTGWIHVLFPYLRAWPADHFIPNTHLDDWLDRWKAAEARQSPLAALAKPEGPGLNRLPPGLTSTSLRFVDEQRREHPLDFISGLIGVTQDPHSLALIPEFVWAIVHDEPAAAAEQPGEAAAAR